MNIKQALEYGINLIKENNIENAFLKARILLSYILNEKKEYLISHDLEEISEENIKQYKECLNRLINNEPIQYITGKQEFYGIEFIVDKSVLIPQPDTEILVEEVINICIEQYAHQSKLNILDLCTGSGAIGIAIAKNIENANITLSDISKNALNIAKKNCINVGEGIYSARNKENNKIKIIQSDLFQNINEKFDIIVSNPPYIKTCVIKTLSKEVQNEPSIALDGGEDGLKIYREIINEAHKYLGKDRHLCLEIGYDQKEEVINLIKNNGNYKDVYSKKDLAGNNRIIICKKT